MRQTIERALAYGAFAYTFVVLASVAADLAWVRTRAAGGGFETFPPGIRLVYAVQAGLMLVLALTLNRTSVKWAGILAIGFGSSTVMQLISRSPDERWNAIPALILAITYFSRFRTSPEKVAAHG